MLRTRSGHSGIPANAAASSSSSALHEAAEATRRLWSPKPEAPLIATGHQAGLRHPGILAKDLVAAALAENLGGEVLRVLVDQDVHRIGPLEVPHSDPDRGLRVLSIPCREQNPESPTGRRPPIEFDAATAPATLSAEFGTAVAAIATALDRESAAPSAAVQVAAAFDALASPCATFAPPRPATTLLATPVGRLLLAAIAENPRRCAEAFNGALARDPRAARPLATDDRRIEVPLWSIAFGRPRERVALDPTATVAERFEGLVEAAEATPSRLAPRGLLMSGLVRLVADLFIHGRGGWRYDRVTEAWFAAWLGTGPGTALAPMAMVSADLRLPIDLPQGEHAAVSRQQLRRRWHDPEADSAARPSASKLADARAIAALPRGTTARREAFHAMHRRLEEARHRRGLQPPPANSSAAGMDPATIAGRRDWAFPLYGASRLRELAAHAADAAAGAIESAQA